MTKFERRASVSLDQLQQRIELLGQQLLDVTAQLVEEANVDESNPKVTQSSTRTRTLCAIPIQADEKSEGGDVKLLV